MSVDGVQQVVSPAVMEEEYALAQTPERCGAEFITRRVALRDSLRQAGTHPMHCQVRIQIYRLLVQRRYRIHSGLK